MPTIDERIPRGTHASAQHFLTLSKRFGEPGAESLAEALFAASAWHGGQRRLTGELFVMHPIQVACLLLHAGMEPPEVTAALLHDVLEDTEASAEELESRFGAEIVRLVEGVTNLKIFSKRENQEKTYAKAKGDPRIAAIKLADATANLMHENQRPFSREKHREHLEEYEEFHLGCLSEIPGIPSLITQAFKHALELSRQELRRRS